MNHLPECSNSMIPDFHNERWICICAALRACEQRVREEWYEVQSETWEQGYKYALDAAREAVAAIKDEHVGDEYKYERLVLRVVLAAIDALREKP